MGRGAMAPEKKRKDKAKRHVLAAKKAERVEVLRESKTERRESKKASKRAAADEDDIDALFAEFKAKDAARSAVTIETGVPPPSPRVNCALVANPLREHELVLFGGECYNGAKTYVYDDLYVYHTANRTWKRVSSPNSPPPRSAHQMVAYRGDIFLFGGEFTSPNQERFHHYRDLWRLNLADYSWAELKTANKGGPTARSGHRMCVWRRKLVIFGGYYDTFREVRYHNDLHAFDLDTYKWSAVQLPPGAPVPSPRSGCGFVAPVGVGDVLYLYGGYVRLPPRVKGEEARGVSLGDMWALYMGANPRWERIKLGGAGQQPPSPRSGFSLVFHKKRAILFGGVRDGEEDGGKGSTFFADLFSFQFDTGRWFPLVVKGARARGDQPEPSILAPALNQRAAGAGDSAQQDGNGETVHSASDGEGAGEEDAGVDYDEERDGARTAEATGVMGAERSAAREAAAAKRERQRERAAEEKEQWEALERKAVLDAKQRGIDLVALKEGGMGVDESTPAGDERVMTSTAGWPSPRINTPMVVAGDNLYLLGGLRELGSREVTLDDVWGLSLTKLDDFECHNPGTFENQEWLGEVSEDDDDDDDDRGDDEGEEGFDTEDDGDEEALYSSGLERASEPAAEGVAGDEGTEGVDDVAAAVAAMAQQLREGPRAGLTRRAQLRRIFHLRDVLQLEDVAHTPAAGEELGAFFERTRAVWTTDATLELSRAADRQGRDVERLTDKELRTLGFELARRRYDSLRPMLAELAELEKRQSADEALEERAGARPKLK